MPSPGERFFGLVPPAGRSLGGDVVFDVPVSARWTVTEVPETEDYGAYVYVSEADAAGAPRRTAERRRHPASRCAAAARKRRRSSTRSSPCSAPTTTPWGASLTPKIATTRGSRAR